MSDRNSGNDDTGSAPEKPHEEEAGERAQLITETLGLSPVTARVAAQDELAHGMRKPASDDVETARIAAAKERDAG
jgi:hypothetical protein